MKYTITGTYSDNIENFNELIKPIHNYISIESLNAGYGRFYFTTEDISSDAYQDIISHFNNVGIEKYNISEISQTGQTGLLNYFTSSHLIDLQEDFTIISNKQNYYNLLKYLEK